MRPDAPAFLRAFKDRATALSEQLSDMCGRGTCVERSMLGSQVLLEALVQSAGPIWTVLSFKPYEGTHAARTTQQFLAIAQQLAVLHACGLCHSDVRESNMVFSCTTDEAWLIDFDYVVREDAGRLYPVGWNTRISDGERHPSADAKQPILRAHDMHSLHAVMARYKPTLDSDIAAWQSILGAFQIHTLQWQGVIERLEAGTFQLTSTDKHPVSPMGRTYV